MNTEQLFSVLSAVHQLSDEFRNVLEKSVTPLFLPRDYMLLEAPKVSGHVYFVDKGFAMSFMYVNGRKLVDHFWKAGEIIISFKSFFEQVPSTEFIELRQDSLLLCLSHTDWSTLYDRYTEVNIISRSLMNKHYERCRERIRDMQYLTATDRYQKMLREYPGVERHVTQECIASYLGIAAQSLSRMKGRMRRS